MNARQLALGTAQFGFAYGVTNARGKLDDATVLGLLQGCKAHGIHGLDTASGYGDSELRLGAMLRNAPDGGWQVVTKTPAAGAGAIDAGVLAAFTRAWRTSLDRLAPLPVHALLLHHADDLLKPGGEALYAWLQERRGSGEVRKIGASVYDASQLEALLERHGGTHRLFDIVQLPASIADQPLTRHPVLRALRESGTEVHVRSLFLQGLLLAPQADASFAGAGAVAWLQRFHQELADRRISPLAACLGYFRSVPEFDVAVVGATSPGELTEIAQAFAAAEPQEWQGWQGDADWVDPRRWSRT